MESPKAGLTEIGQAIQSALGAEGDRASDVRLARAGLIHQVTHGEAAAARRERRSLLLDVRVLGAFIAPIVLMAGWVFWAMRPVSFAVGSALAKGQLGDVVEASGHAALPLSFSDGSSLLLGRGGRARVLSLDSAGARVLLESGDAEVSIQRRVGRDARWHLEAGPLRILVTGTRFHVEWSPATQTFKLSMREGTVVVSGRCLAGPRTLGAGEVLALACAPQGTPTEQAAPLAAKAVSEPEPTPPAIASGALSSEGEASALAAAGVPARPASQADPLRSCRDALSAGRWAEALQAAEALDFAHVTAIASQADLLMLADAARLSGRSDRAVQALGAVRRRFAGSSGAALAAFALGRIAFDQQQAYAEAARWFSAYLAEQPSGPLMGDAFGRLLEARERQGDHAGAQSDAERYLRRFPQGPYALQARKILAQ